MTKDETTKQCGPDVGAQQAENQLSAGTTLCQQHCHCQNAFLHAAVVEAIDNARHGAGVTLAGRQLAVLKGQVRAATTTKVHWRVRSNKMLI